MHHNFCLWKRLSTPFPARQLHIAVCQLVYDMLYYKGGLTADDLQRMDQYLSTMEIARSCSFDLGSHATNSIELLPWEVLDKLLPELEKGALRLPSELYARLLSMMTSLICMAKSGNASAPELQLRILKCMELRSDMPAGFKADMVLLHFQCESFLCLSDIGQVLTRTQQ